ncbi:MAG: homocysteine S-methyltransferase family protein [Clostridia bacterium]|nr:homocysteine S-methyltransferase family protein [Clostridia bacterium]
MHSFSEELKNGRLLLDGSMGALLSSMGKKSDHPELFNITEPEVIRGIHESYIKAGANVVITDSLGATPLRLRRSDLKDRAAELTEAAVKNARAAAGDRALVALDIGPSGEFMQPSGQYTLKEMMDSFSVCAEAGAKAGADFILLETMTDVSECRAACLAARKTNLPIAASFTFENGRTLTGSSPECAALTLAAAGACAVGVNCSTGPEQMLAPLAAMRKVTPLPVIVQPNAGLPEIDDDGNAHYRFTPEDMLPHMKAILDAGAAAIGGCCGTTPAHIALFSSLDLSSPAEPAWDGTKYICSARAYVSLDEALENAAETDDIEDLYDLEDEAAAILNLTGTDADEVADLLIEAQMATNLPLIFRCSDESVLEEALINYPGVAAVYAPEACAKVCDKYGAYRIG